MTIWPKLLTERGTFKLLLMPQVSSVSLSEITTFMMMMTVMTGVMASSADEYSRLAVLLAEKKRREAVGTSSMCSNTITCH